MLTLLSFHLSNKQVLPAGRLAGCLRPAMLLLTIGDGRLARSPGAVPRFPPSQRC